MSGFSNFAVSFTIISILSGCLTLYGFGMNTGGPAVIVWGWPFIGIMTLFVGLSMAEVCSSFPTAGGLYYWSAKLARKNGGAWSWFTGWFNFLGQVAVTAGIDFGAAVFLTAFLNLQWGYPATPGYTILIYGLILLLQAQYTFTGYAASAHMTEETHDAARSGPRGSVMSIVVSLFAGWVLLIGVTFAIQNYAGEVGSATGVPPAQIFIDAVGLTGGKLLLLIAIGAQLFCGMSSVTANSRMIYAFSRDGAVPGSAFWHRVNKRTRTPTNAIWLAAAGAFLLGLPYLWNYTAYAAVTSIAVIGLYIAYVMPTFLRLRQGESFQRGPWHLGRWSTPIGVIAVTWVAIITVLFMLPQVSPVTWLTFNYAVFAVLAVIGFAGIYWLVSARKWFTGPRVQGTPEELAAIERELEV